MSESISKDEAVDRLLEKGYDAFYDKGVVKVRYPKDYSDSFVEEAEAFLKEIGYSMSRGFVPNSEGVAT